PISFCIVADAINNDGPTEKLLLMAESIKSMPNPTTS
ncbi:MAG: hypothetical protein JWN98_2506, partial [Abditibacteriota bacterium]|nr:hypothetical protein [Abditibacteriota bacterium]